MASPCMVSPVRERMKSLPFMTIGLDMPPMSLVQMMFLPAGLAGVGGSHSLGRFFWRETPRCSGPRQWGQSPALGVIFFTSGLVGSGLVASDFATGWLPLF